MGDEGRCDEVGMLEDVARLDAWYVVDSPDDWVDFASDEDGDGTIVGAEHGTDGEETAVNNPEEDVADCEIHEQEDSGEVVVVEVVVSMVDILVVVS